MRKADLVEVVRQEVGHKKDAVKIVDIIFNAIKERVIAGDDVLISDFGKFGLRTRAERKAHNPQTGEEIIVPEHKLPYFKPDKAFKNAVN